LPKPGKAVKGCSMELEQPRFVPLGELSPLRPRLPVRLTLTGMWVAGDLAGLERPTVAVVGCRAASEAGRARARSIARGLAEAGVCVISGLALGIDGSAHEGALAGGGPTIGVLGGGHRCFFPRRNRPLAQAMLAARGAVVSPYAPDAPALPFQFLHRNGLVAGLADALVVVEAAARSGAMNTATWASNCNIDVFAVPGDVDRAKAAGCNELIRQGAVLVRDADDVLAGIRLASGPRAPEAPVPETPDDPLEAAVLEALANESRTLDDLLDGLGVETGALTGVLVRLELAGRLRRGEDLRFARL
jgi:DNA processing protein